VRPGRGIGRRLGFPTLNIRYSEEVLVPEGVLAGFAEIDGETYRAAVNSGRRPTLGGGGHLVEIHLLSDAVPENPRRVTLFPVKKIRDEMRFDSPEELATRIAEDCRIIGEILAEEERRSVQA